MPLPSRRLIVWVTIIVSVLGIAGLLFYLLKPEQHYDPNFDTRIAAPAYGKGGPRVLFDEAHRNEHTMDGRYKGFADLMRADGYDIQRLTQAITAERLSGVSVLVIVGAQGSNETNDAPAFTEAEAAAVERWVRSGGSLLLITDHWPFGPAAEPMAQRFGIDMGKGIVQDQKNFEPSRGDTHIVFSRANGFLSDHPITRGRNQAEQIHRVLTFTGQSLRGPANSVAFLRLADTAADRPPSVPRVEKEGGDVRVIMDYGDPVSAKGRAQGLAFEIDKGRVVVLGDAGMASAQLDGKGAPVGMNYPGYDNRQLALNIMHWLSKLL